MKPYSTFVILIAILVPLLSWGGGDNDLSHIPGAFVDIGYGARPMGMGGAYVGLADDHNAPIWNPAGMLRVQGHGVNFMWAKQLGFIPYNYLSYSGELAPDHRIGGALIFSGDDLLTENTFLTSYATTLKRINPRLAKVYVGINVKIRWASFGNNSGGDPDRVTGDAFGYGIDLGTMWIISEKAAAGLLLRDFLNDITWNSSTSGKYSEAVPGEMVMGLSLKPAPKAVIAADLRKALHQDVEDRLMIGVEYRVLELLTLRAGWGRNIDAEYHNQDISLGIGLYRKISRLDFRFDFAYMLNDVKNTPRVGAGFDW